MKIASQEPVREKIYQVFAGVSSKESGCANAETALSEMCSEEGLQHHPMQLLMSFVANCTPENFAEIKKLWLGTVNSDYEFK